MEYFNFDYYYGDESSQFSFYRVPRQLITSPSFKRLCSDTKLLYGLLLDRMGLSARNGWHDKAVKRLADSSSFFHLQSGQYCEPHPYRWRYLQGQEWVCN